MHTRAEYLKAAERENPLAVVLIHHPCAYGLISLYMRELDL